MKSNIRFAKILYCISLIAYYICFVCLGLTFVISVFKFSFNGFNPKNIASYQGYAVESEIYIKDSDSIISYSYQNENKIACLKSSFFKSQKFDTILNNPKYKYSLISNRFIIYDKDSTDISASFGKVYNHQLNVKGSLHINPSNPLLIFLLEIRNYLVYILLSFIFWQISQFFKVLDKDFSFHINLKIKLKTIAFSLIGYQLIVFILSLIYMTYVSRAEVLTSIPNIGPAELLTITYKTSPEYNLQILFFALGLLCIAQLLGYGHKLQQENELTI